MRRSDRLCRVLIFLLLQPALAFAGDTAGTRRDDDITIRLSASADRDEPKVFPSILRIRPSPDVADSGTNGDVLMSSQPAPYTTTGVLIKAKASWPSVSVKLGNAANTSAFDVNTSGDVNLFRVRGDGFVGIGTSSPGVLLHVSGTTPGDYLQKIVNNDQSATGGFGLFVDTTTSSGNLNNTNARFGIRVNNNFVVTNAGNVGVGTTSPQAALHVTGITRSDNRIESRLGGSDTVAGGSSLFLGNTTGDYVGIQQSANNDLDFWTFNNGWFNRMKLSNSGNLGIGTAGAPQTRLELLSPNGVAETFRSTYQPYGTSFRISNIADAANINDVVTLEGFKQNGTSIGKVCLKAGNVGIGTPAPVARLDVNGSAHVTGDVVVTGSITGATVINAVYQDLAEWVETSEELQPGTVVALDPNRTDHVLQSRHAYD